METAAHAQGEKKNHSHTDWWSEWSVFCVLVLPGLQALDATQHVQVAGWVLLDDVLDVVGSQRLLELLLGDVELHYPAEKAGQFTNWPQGRALAQLLQGAPARYLTTRMASQRYCWVKNLIYNSLNKHQFGLTITIRIITDETKKTNHSSLEWPLKKTLVSSIVLYNRTHTINILFYYIY